LGIADDRLADRATSRRRGPQRSWLPPAALAQWHGNGTLGRARDHVIRRFPRPCWFCPASFELRWSSYSWAARLVRDRPALSVWLAPRTGSHRLSFSSMVGSPWSGDRYRTGTGHDHRAAPQPSLAPGRLPGLLSGLWSRTAIGGTPGEPVARPRGSRRRDRSSPPEIGRSAVRPRPWPPALRRAYSDPHLRKRGEDLAVLGLSFGGVVDPW
jgi:hypothetical protein